MYEYFKKLLSSARDRIAEFLRNLLNRVRGFFGYSAPASSGSVASDQPAATEDTSLTNAQDKVIDTSLTDALKQNPETQQEAEASEEEQTTIDASLTDTQEKIDTPKWISFEDESDIFVPVPELNPQDKNPNLSEQEENSLTENILHTDVDVDAFNDDTEQDTQVAQVLKFSSEPSDDNTSNSSESSFIMDANTVGASVGVTLPEPKEVALPAAEPDEITSHKKKSRKRPKN